MIDLHLQQGLKQSLELLLSPRMLQMLKVLSVPYMELVEHIVKEAEENPVLEVECQDEYLEYIRYLTSDKEIKKGADFKDLPGLENVGNVEKTLEEHLLDQLELEDLESPQKEIAKEIIENIDDFGYVVNYPKLRDRIMKKHDISRPTVDKILKIVQSFEPEGVGARNLRECLLIQISEFNFENEALENLLTRAIDKHLEDISEEKFNKVSKALGIPETGVKEIAEFIKTNLHPNPAAAFGGETKHVIPSFAVEKDKKGYKIIALETRYGPKINLSPQYIKMLEDPKTDEETKTFLREKLKKAKNLIEDFGKRSETMGKIVRKIVETQEDFLSRGITWLNPLAQKDLADGFGLHPSTISRSIAQKYIQTPQGLYQLKFLCPRGPRGMTVARMKSLLVECVKNEAPEDPLSDSQLTEELKKKGAGIDRRTVAYYRKELKILPYSERKKI
ncbi:MAG: RNA polymerase factor sigma-54 [Candidatus Margulisiibacteriota bacterium]|nr:RNA polymerase factor sigma-54 [Candidatus Margulisiibacteriota bacterium]